MAPADHEPRGARERLHIVEHRLVQRRVAYDAAFPDVSASHLELRLHERDDGALRRQQALHRRQHEAERDERRIDRREIERLGYARRVELADVRTLEAHDASILAELPRELAVSDVD